MPYNFSSFLDFRNPNYFRNRLLSYGILLSFVLVISYIVLSSVGLQNNDVNSTRYLISALIQSEAAILAIVITLSIFAIQQASSSYSTRIILIFKDLRKNPDFYVIIFTYTMSIIYGCWILKQLRGNEKDIVNLGSIIFPSFDTHILINYSLGIFSFILLTPYIIHTLNMLNPNTIIDKLSIEINEINLKSINKENSEKNQINDSILPIIDIIQKSLMEYDYETSQYGFEALTDKLIPLFSDGNLSEDDKENLFNLFFKHILKIGKLAASKNDEIFVINLLEAVERIVPLRIENPINRKAPIALIKEIGIMSANQELNHATNKAIDLLDEIFDQIPNEKKHDEILLDIFSSLISIGELVVEQKLKISLSKALSSIDMFIERSILEDFGTQEIDRQKYLEHKQKLVKHLLKEVYKSIGESAFETKSRNTLTSLSSSFKKNGIFMLDKKWDDDIIRNILEWLVEIGEFTIGQKNMKNLEQKNIANIQKIYKSAIKNKKYSIALTSCDSELKLEPNSYEAWIRKGDALYDLNHNRLWQVYEEAEYYYLEANKIKPSPKAWLGIKKSREGMLDFKGAQDAENEYFLLLHEEAMRS